MTARGPQRRDARRVAVGEAARLLGISKDAVRMRIRRGTLRSEKTDNKVYVWMDDEAYGDHNDVHPQAGIEGSPSRELVAEMRERIVYLERQVEEEREARRRADTLLARLMDNIPALEAPQERPEAPETVEEGPEGAEPRSASGGTQEAVGRPWWRRVFGG